MSAAARAFPKMRKTARIRMSVSGRTGLPSREAGQEQQPSAITGDGAAALDEEKTETELKDRDAGEFSRSFPSDAPSGGGEAADENKISAEWQGTNCPLRLRNKSVGAGFRR